MTRRERDCLELVAEGLTNPEIAARLFVARETVHRHLGDTYRRLHLEGVGNPRVVAAIMWAERDKDREGS